MPYDRILRSHGVRAHVRKRAGGAGRPGGGGRVKKLKYVFECRKRSIGWWEAGWKVSSPREELALPRSARRTAPPCPL